MLCFGCSPMLSNYCCLTETFERDHKPKIVSLNFIFKYSLILPRKTKETRSGFTNLKGLVKNIRSMEKGKNSV